MARAGFQSLSPDVRSTTWLASSSSYNWRGSSLVPVPATASECCAAHVVPPVFGRITSIDWKATAPAVSPKLERDKCKSVVLGEYTY